MPAVGIEAKWHISGMANLDELIATEGQREPYQIIMDIEQALNRKSARVGEQNLSEEERTVLAIEALEQEVNNGGYGQFFTNSSNEYAPMIVGAVSRIGCPKTAEITRRAVSALDLDEMTPEALDDKLSSGNDELDRALDECDQSYYKSGEDIAGRLFEFVKANRESIQF